MTWKDFCETGGGSGTFVFYVHGMPWAVQSKEHPWSGTTQERTIFGARSVVVDGVTSYPTDNVDRLTLLQMPSGWDLEFNVESNWITGGDISISIDDEPALGLDLSWYTDRDVWGLEGVHAVTDYRVDTGIRTGILSRSLFDSSDVLYIENDIDDQLFDKITTNIAADDPTYLWIGNECVAAYGTLSSTGLGTFSVKIARGMLKTKPQNHLVNQRSVASILVADCPVGGLQTRRPASLWYVPEDATSAPDRIWTGYTGTRTNRKSGTIKISCEHWLKNLDTDFVSRSDRFRVSGYSVNLDWTGQLVLIERDPASGDWVRTGVSLAGSGTAHYSNYEELQDAINEALKNAYPGSLKYAYRLSGNKLSHIKDDYAGLTAPVQAAIGSRDNFPSMVGGPLAWLLGIGAPFVNQAGKDDWAIPYMSGDLAQVYNVNHGAPFKSTSTILNGIYRRCAAFDGKYYNLTDTWTVSPEYATPSYRAEWFLQSAGSYSSNGTVDLTNQKLTNFAPIQPIYVDTSTLVETIDTDGKMRAGNTDSATADDGYEFETTISEVDTGANTITTGTIQNTSEGGRDFFARDTLCYIPAIHDQRGGDPLIFSQAIYPQTKELTPLLESIFGDSDNPAQVPKYVQILHIPDIIPETVSSLPEQIGMIDFDQLDRLVDPLFWGHVYKLYERSQSDKFSEIFAAELLFHGVAPTWRWDQDQHGYTMGFARLGLPHSTEANVSGRFFDDEDRELYSETTIQNSDGQVYNQLDAHFGYVPSEDTYANSLKIIDDTGMEYTGRNTRALSITTKISTYDQTSDPGHVDGKIVDTIYSNEPGIPKPASGAVTVSKGGADPRVRLSALPPVTASTEYIVKSEESNNLIFSHLKSNVLRQYSYPVPLIESRSMMKTNTSIELNGVFLATNSDAHNPYTGQKGFSLTPARARKMRYKIDGDTGSLTYILGVGGYRGIAPSCMITGAEYTDANTIEITDTALADPINHFTDGDMEQQDEDSWDQVGSTKVYSKDTSNFYSGDQSMIVDGGSVGDGYSTELSIPPDPDVRYLISGRTYNNNTPKLRISDDSPQWRWSATRATGGFSKWNPFNLIWDAHSWGGDVQFIAESPAATPTFPWLVDNLSAVQVRNLLDGGQCESTFGDSSDWTTTGGATLAYETGSSIRHSGFSSFKITGGGSAGSGVYQIFTDTPSTDKIQLRLWLKNATASESAGVYQDGVLKHTTAANTNWQYVELELLAQDGDEIKIAHTNTSTGIIYMDELVCFTYADARETYFSLDDARPDLTWFDCYTFNPSTGVLTLNTNCSCTDYSVIVFEADNPSPTFFRGTVGSIQQSGGKWIGTVSATGIGTALDTSKNYVMIFGEFDDSDTQDCQRLFGYFANAAGRLNDGVSSQNGNRWK